MGAAWFYRSGADHQLPDGTLSHMDENYVGDPALGRACHGRRKRFDLVLESSGQTEPRRAFYRALASAGIGREVVLIAKISL